MFLNTDLADEEKDCYGDCMQKAIEYFMQGKFEKAAIYHEHIIRSLKQLERLKREKEDYKRLQLILKQMEGDQQMRIITAMKLGCEYAKDQ